MKASNENKRILITGAAGYVGQLLVYALVKRPDVELIICLDKEPAPKSFNKLIKIKYLERNLVDAGWENEVMKHEPSVVINCAWQIRALYGEKRKQRHWNIDGSDRLFKFVVSNPGINRLVHFSTIASYGAERSNTFTSIFNEESPLRFSKYSYAEEKRIAENNLLSLYKNNTEKLKERGCQIAVLRPASISGPVGRLVHTRFGLQSALLGNKPLSGWHKFVSLLTAWVPVTPLWCRQFVHEDDIVDITILLALKENLLNNYEIINAAPPGDIVLGKDMASVVGKKILLINPLIVRIAFFLAWYISLGHIPTAPGSWRGYSYPIVVDGDKISKLYGYKYQANSKDALSRDFGKYFNKIAGL